MGCVNCDCEGVCDLYDRDGGGFDAGYDDPDPAYSCPEYNSDGVDDELDETDDEWDY